MDDETQIEATGVPEEAVEVPPQLGEAAAETAVPGRKPRVRKPQPKPHTPGTGGSSRSLVAKRPRKNVVNEPFRENIGGHAQLPIDVDPALCAICSTNRGIGDHHIVFRSRGGHDGPTMPVCPQCHDNVHMYKWKLDIEEDGLYIYDAEGQLVWRRKKWPLVTPAGDFVMMLERVTDALPLMKDLASALLPHEAVEWHSTLRRLGESSWKATARLIGEMYTYRMPGVAATDKADAIGRAFTLRRAQVYNYVLLYQTFHSDEKMEESHLGQQYFLEAARSTKPQEYIVWAEQQKVEHPSFSRKDLKDKIANDGNRRYEGEMTSPREVLQVWAKCPSCEHIGWMAKLPVGDEGEVVA